MLKLGRYAKKILETKNENSITFISMSQFDLKDVSDNILLQRTSEGDECAFKQLFQKYWQPSFSEAFKRIGDYDQSKDIVQEIFTHIWTHRETVSIENLPAYLETSIRNRVIKF